MKTKLFLTGLAMIATTAIMSAQGPGRGAGRCNGTGRGTACVDNNKNGVCDNYENRATTRQGKATSTGRGYGQGRGRNFVDANKNGVCDYLEASVKK